MKRITLLYLRNERKFTSLSEELWYVSPKNVGVGSKTELSEGTRASAIILYREE